MSFGWSAGDIIAGINLIKDVCQALDSAKGAAHDFQETVIFLESLEQALQSLHTLPDLSAYPSHGDQITEQVRLLKVPIQKFLDHVKKYQPTLGPKANTSWIRQIPRKLRWRFFESVSQEALSLKKKIDSHMNVLHLLMASLSVDMLKSREEAMPEKVLKWVEEALEPKLLSSTDEVAKMLKTKSAMDHRTTENLGYLCATLVKVLHDNLDSQRQLEALVQSQSALLSHARSKDDTGHLYHLLRRKTNHGPGKIGHWSAEVDTQKTDRQDAWQELVYLIPLFLRRCFLLLAELAWPSSQLTSTVVAKSNIIFFDAMGSPSRVLPLNNFQGFAVLQAFIQEEFRHSSVISAGQYLIFDENDRVLNERNWRDSIAPGMKIAMSVILRSVKQGKPMVDFRRCPRPSCSGARMIKPAKGWLKCSKCHKRFFIGSLRENGTELRHGPFVNLPRYIQAQKPRVSPILLATNQVQSPQQVLSGQGDQEVFNEIEQLDKHGEFMRVLPDITDIWSALSRINAPSPYDPLDIAHVKEKFPQIPEQVAVRLGRANGLRRRVFGYWNTEKANLSTTKPDFSGLHPRGLNPSSFLQVPGTRSIRTRRETAGETTMLRSSRRPFYYRENVHSLGLLERLVPHSDSDWADCLVCHKEISIKKLSDFRHHIKQDVRFYVCVHDDCENSIKLFRTANEWVQHADDDHEGEWFPLTGPSLGSHCPMCLESVRDPRIHVQRHMVDVAMFSTEGQARQAKKSDSNDDANSLTGNFDEENNSRGLIRDIWDLENLGNFQDSGEFQMSISKVYE